MAAKKRAKGSTSASLKKKPGFRFEFETTERGTKKLQTVRPTAKERATLGRTADKHMRLRREADKLRKELDSHGFVKPDHKQARSLEEWQGSVDRQLRALRLHGRWLRKQASAENEFTLLATQVLMMLGHHRAKAQMELEQQIEEMLKEKAKHPKGWAPDIDWWLKFMQIMRATAVVFGHVEHDVIDLIDKK